MTASIPVENLEQGATDRPARLPKKKLVRRTARDYSQQLRRGFQIAFLILNVWLGTQFYFWVRHFETGGQSRFVSRPPGVEGWLPIAGLMNTKFLLITGHVPPVHPAAMFLLITFVAISFFFRKAFCGWLCPVGTVSEYLWKLGRSTFKRNFVLPRWLDMPLRGLKYLLFGFFLWAVSTMSAEGIAQFLQSPYGLIADVKMLNFFRFLSTTAAIVLAVLVVASVFVQNFWCRYLCPYGALLGFASLISPLRIRRESEPCIDCAKCANVCPSVLPVDQLITIKSAECTGCMECVAVCPAEGALYASLPRVLVWGRASSPVQTSTGSPSWRSGRLPDWAMAAGIALLFFGIVGYAKWSDHWATHVHDRVYMELVPHANEASHPMPGE
jgi:polyferredoxin